jgi:hypothetical protein
MNVLSFTYRFTLLLHNILINYRGNFGFIIIAVVVVVVMVTATAVMVAAPVMF